MAGSNLPQDLDAVAAWITRALERGAADPRSPFHWPTLATMGVDGSPRQRTLVLREALPAARRLILATDRRTPKVQEIAANPAASVHVHDQKKRVQLRLSGEAEVVTGGPLWERFWQKAARRPDDYAAEPRPGTPIAARTGLSRRPETAADNFSIIQFTYKTGDFLSLGREGHLRTLVNFSVEPPEATWLVP